MKNKSYIILGLMLSLLIQTQQLVYARIVTNLNPVAYENNTQSPYFQSYTSKHNDGEYDNNTGTITINDIYTTHTFSQVVDASIIDTPLRPKGKPFYEILEQEEVCEESAVKESEESHIPSPAKSYSSGFNQEGAWVKKAGKLRYGYKKHVVTDKQGLVLGVLTTLPM